MTSKLNDSAEIALVQRSAHGDQRAFALLVERYKGMVYTTAQRILRDSGQAEDAAQCTFIKAWSALPAFQGNSKFSSWLYRICYNTCISELRKRKPDVELDESIPDDSQSPGQDFRNRGIRQVLEDEVSRLPDDYRAMITLYHLDGLSYDEIAQTTHRPMGTVKATIHRARALLRTRLVERVGWDQLKAAMWQ